MCGLISVLNITHRTIGMPVLLKILTCSLFNSTIWAHYDIYLASYLSLNEFVTRNTFKIRNVWRLPSTSAENFLTGLSLRSNSKTPRFASLEFVKSDIHFIRPVIRPSKFANYYISDFSNIFVLS